MKFLGMIIKAILSLVAGAYFLSDSILTALVIFCVVYGLISFYLWYFKRTGFSFSIWIGEKGFMMTLISLAIKVLAPIIILAIITITCNSLIPGEAGATVGGLIIVVICLGFLVLDVLTIIQHFNPSIKVPFQNKDNNK